MKKIIFLSLIISLIIGSCIEEKKSPIEGTWQVVQVLYISGDTITNAFPGIYTGGQMKMWSKNHFVFVGIAKVDTTIYDLYGGGTYTLNGDKYEENIIYHSDKPLVNTKFKALLEIRNDTLIQKNSTDDNWKLPKQYNIEKYVRAE